MIVDGAVVLVGPTLPKRARPEDARLEYRAPAMRGDVYRAALEDPRAILLIDGAFENSPAVFHKEILWALAKGIHVYGSSSLGALRAAELEPYGMIGIGKVFQSYRTGALDRDDAVAVLHGPEDVDWPLLTTALVDIDATLARACEHGVITSDELVVLRATADRLFWREREYDRLLAESCSAGLATLTADRLGSWLELNKFSQKALDALDLIAQVLATWDDLQTGFSADFAFEQTLAWHAVKSDIDWDIQGMSPATFQRLEQSLRTQGLFEPVEAHAIALTLADEIISDPMDDGDIERAARIFRVGHALERGDDLIRWLDSRSLHHSDYLDILKDARNLERIRETRHQVIAKNIVRILRQRGLMSVYRGEFE